MKSQALEGRQDDQAGRSDVPQTVSMSASSGGLPGEDQTKMPAERHCGRCSGLLYWTELREWDGSRGQDDFGALQCILCGNVIDPVIVKNRRRALGSGSAPERSHGRRWRWVREARVS